jgi:tripartite-type tricarboxylate transporter receptor subunit TctC
MKIEVFRRKFNQGTGSFGPTAGLFAFLLIVSLAILALPGNSGAKDWPTKPITLIVPWPAGGGADRAARLLAPKLSKILDVPILVVNKPGASGIIGTLEAVKAPPDGYTLLLECNGGSSIQYAWAENLPYKVEERAYIARAVFTPMGMIVPASSPWKTVEDLAQAIRTNPGSISFGAGAGAPDVPIAQFRAALMAKGIDVSKVRPVTFKGSGEIYPAIAGGHVSFSFASPGGVNALISAGKIRVLAMSSPKRYEGWPDVPTMAEAGFPSVNGLFWAGLGGPPGLPAPIAKILDNALKETLGDPEIIDKLGKGDFFLFYLSGDNYKKFVLDEGKAIKALNLR